MKKNILITGATGYIGSNLARYCLGLGLSVSILVRENSRFNYLDDIKDKVNIFVYDGTLKGLEEFLKINNIEVVMHLASLYITEHKSEEVCDLVDSNIQFGAILLEAMKNSNVKYLINTATTWQHYNNEDFNPVNLYAATKEAFESILRFYTEKEYIKAITLEIFDTYGYGDNRGKLLNNLYKFSVEGNELAMSGGMQKLDLVFIDDIVKGYIMALERLSEKDVKNEKYGLFSDKAISLKDLISLYEEVKGVKLNIKWGEKPYREREVMEPSYRVEKLPGWSSQMMLEEGIKYIK